FCRSPPEDVLRGETEYLRQGRHRSPGKTGMSDRGRLDPELRGAAPHFPAGKDPGRGLHQPDGREGARMNLGGALAIWRRDMLVLRRSIVSEMIAVLAYPLTIYLAFGIGMQGYIGLVEGIP